MVEIGAFRVFIRRILNIEPYSPLKPTKVGFIFIGPPKSSIRSHELWSKMSLIFDLKAGFEKIRPVGSVIDIFNNFR